MESLYKLMGEPLSTLVCMLVGIPMFSIGSALIGVYGMKVIAGGAAWSPVLTMSIAVTTVGFISLTFGFIGLTESIIERELVSKGYI